MSDPAEHFARRARSVDFHPLPIDELKGTKPTEQIDLSNKTLAKGLGVASAIIIASCIKGNGSLKKLRCVAFPPRFPANMSGPAEHFSFARSLAGNRLCGIWTEDGLQEGTYTTEGITALCEGLKGSAVTSLT